MKYYTHPVLKYTFIQSKDGSSYGKYWLYFRDNLFLEIDSKAWENTNNRTKQSQQRFTLSKANHDIYNQNENSFWILKNKKI